MNPITLYTQPEGWNQNRLQVLMQRLGENDQKLLPQVINSCASHTPESAYRLLDLVQELQANTHSGVLKMLLHRPFAKDQKVEIERVLQLIQKVIFLAQQEYDIDTFLEENKDIEMQRLLNMIEEDFGIMRRLQDEDLTQLRKAFTQQSESVRYPLSEETFDLLVTKLQAIYALTAQREGWGLEEIRQQANLLREKNNFEITELLSLAYVAYYKITKMHPYPTQLVTLLAILEKKGKGTIAQVRTGEGKSLIVTLMAFVLAMQGRKVDIISSSEYLARRDQKKFVSFFSFFGITTSHICEERPSLEKYRAQIIYGTNYNFEFSLLREWLKREENSRAILERGADCALIDEVDNLFVDISMNSARIALPKREQEAWVWPCLLDLVRTMPQKVQSSSLLAWQSLPSCIQSRFEAMPEETLSRRIASAQRALHELNEEKDYVLKEKKIVIIDKDNTGRQQEGSRWSYGVHQLLECKHGLNPEEQQQMPASISHAVYFARYRNLYGLTGTIGDNCERNEIADLYGVDSFDVPPHKLHCGKQLPTCIFDSKEDQWNFLRVQIRRMQAARRPLLLLVASIEESKRFAALLQKEEIACHILNDVQEEDEEEIITCAGHAGKVTIATNTAGRGTDILLSEEALVNGGLHVVVTFFPANARVQAQAFGRAARQGQPGSYQLVLCKEETTVSQFLREQDTTILSEHTSLLRQLETMRHDQIQDLSNKRLLRAHIEQQRHKALDVFIQRLREWQSSVSDAWLEQKSKELGPEFRVGQHGRAFSQTVWKEIAHHTRERFLNTLIEHWSSSVYEKIDNFSQQTEQHCLHKTQSKIERLCQDFWQNWLEYMEPPQEGFFRYIVSNDNPPVYSI